VNPVIHLARLEQPAEAFRAACGAWRERSNWTTTPSGVTCPACREVVEAGRAQPGGTAGGAAAVGRPRGRIHVR
jgi:hypothetical protein